MKRDDDTLGRGVIVDEENGLVRILLKLELELKVPRTLFDMHGECASHVVAQSVTERAAFDLETDVQPVLQRRLKHHLETTP